MNQSGAIENSKFIRLNFFQPARTVPSAVYSWWKRMGAT
jgi:hypothetical protein